MPLPNQPVTLTAAQVAELDGKLSTMRHDINNKLCLIIACVELMRQDPQKTERMLENLTAQSPIIEAALRKFSDEFDQMLGITPR